MKIKMILTCALLATANVIYAQREISNPVCQPNSYGLITLEECPEQHQQLTVKLSEERDKITIYYNGQVMQELTTDDEFTSPIAEGECPVYFLDANFDGKCDIFVGPGLSRTYSTLLLWNSQTGKFEPLTDCDGAALQNIALDPVNKRVFDGGSSSYCEEDGDMMVWNGNKLEIVETLVIISDPTQYRANGVKYMFTVKNKKTGRLVKATNYKQNLPTRWRNYVSSMGL